jgi:predicted glutamine amidotransferase
MRKLKLNKAKNKVEQEMKVNKDGWGLAEFFKSPNGVYEFRLIFPHPNTNFIRFGYVESENMLMRYLGVIFARTPATPEVRDFKEHPFLEECLQALKENRKGEK